METLKYRVIKNKKQYKEYCDKLESLLQNSSRNKEVKDEIELLTFLVEKWDDEHNSFKDTDPVQLLTSLMEENNLKAKDLVGILNVSKGYISDILNYKKGLLRVILLVSDPVRIQT
ncbi:MAG TPA: hypothetical protein VHC50_09455 [Puia sp.]|nr:hypothetical protein [Puia sp.]